MRHRTIAVFLAMSMLALAGCQGVNAPESHRGICVQRAYEQGFCEQPTNFHLSTFLVTGHG